MARVIDGQIELLEDMKKFLSDLIHKFNEMTRTQENFVRSLESEGLDYNFLERFEESVKDNKGKINLLIMDIELEQIPYTESVIRRLEDSISI